jgi:hypothetical protein
MEKFIEWKMKIKKNPKWKILHGYYFAWICILKINQSLESFPPILVRMHAAWGQVGKMNILTWWEAWFSDLLPSKVAKALVNFFLLIFDGSYEINIMSIFFGIRHYVPKNICPDIVPTPWHILFKNLLKKERPLPVDAN